jgi:hypothetical protein
MPTITPIAEIQTFLEAENLGSAQDEILSYAINCQNRQLVGMGPVAEWGDNTLRRTRDGEAYAAVKDVFRHLPDLFRPAGITAEQWAKAAKMITVSTTAPTIIASSTSGYVKLLRWDGTFGTVTANNAALNTGAAIATPYNSRLPKLVAVFPCDSGGAIAGELTNLNCFNTQLTSLDVSSCTSLIELMCAYNQITSLDVSSCTSLTGLYCANNQLTSLDVSSNTSLISIGCPYNQITSLDVSSCPSLITLSCGDNQLTSLDVNSNLALVILECANNQLTDIYVGFNPLLDTLYCNNNQLTSLNVASNPLLKELICRNNQLAALNVSSNPALYYLSCGGNLLTSLNVSSNTLLSTIICNNNLFDSTAHDAFYNSFPTSLESTEAGYCDSSGQPGPVTSASATKRNLLITDPGVWTAVITAI